MRLAFSLALLTLALPAAAQPSFGVKLGLNAATVSGISDENLFGGDDGIDDGISKQSRLGFVGGLTADIPLSPAFSFRPELLYAQKGFTVLFEFESDGRESAEEGLDATITKEIDYLEVPLLLAYRFPTANALEVSIEAGPTLAYELRSGLGCGGDFEDSICGSDELDEEDDGDGTRTFDLGAAIGATVGAGPLGVGLRYTAGLTSLDDNEFSSDDDISVRNQVISVTAHYRFGR